jgi:signal transduction histidine kinase
MVIESGEGDFEEYMKMRGIFSRQTIIQFTHSIRFRLVLWFVLILGVVMALFSGFVYWRQAQDIRSIALGRLNYSLEHLLGPSNEGDHDLTHLLSVSPDTVNTMLYVNANLQQSDVVALQAADGTILQSSGVLTAEQIQHLQLPLTGWSGIEQISVPKTPSIENNQYLFINPAILQNGQINGYLLLGVPLDANNQLGRLLVSLVIGNLLTLAIALTGGFWLADRALRPVRTITHTARQISETDLHKRLHLPGKDELSELGNTFDDMLNRLQVAFERQRQFTADASHELRTPLTIIDLEASRALSIPRSADEYTSILHTIKSENQFMVRLVNNLLALARMDAGQVKIKADPLDLSEIAAEVIERMSPLAAAQGVSMNVGDLPKIPILGDRSTLTQMLTNLVENAIKYSASVADPNVQISAGRREEGDRNSVWVRVSDNGIGIAPESQGRIFDRFYQVDASRTRTDGSDEDVKGPDSSGTGLGLAIAQWIAQAHHGEIRVKSEVGKGSTFEVILPEYNPSNGV